MAQSRQLAAIMFTDIVGYTALMEKDEKRAFEVLKKNLRIHQSVIDAHQGRLIKELGDGILASFPTVTEALNAAINIQEECNKSNEFKLSIGIHQGEVVFENGDVFGDAVNVASRIQSLGTARSILFSKRIADEIKNKIEFRAVSLGLFEFKNIDEAIEVFALANDGFTVPQRNSIEGKLKKSSRKRTVVAVLGMVLLLLSAYFIVKISYSNNDKVDTAGKSIAVLPFQNMSNDPDQEYFSDGMTDQIITSLAKLKVLRVIGRTSMMHYKGTKKTIPEIAKELNSVSYVLEGSIQKSGNRIKVNAQLIRADDNFHQWAEVYEGDLSDIFAVQDELSTKIAQALLGELHSDQKGLLKTDRPANAEAYEYYLRAIHFHYGLDSRNTMEDLQRVERMFLTAISLDPGFASAYGALADYYDSRGEMFGYASSTKYWSLRDSVVRIGYKIDPNSHYVLFAKGLTYYKRLNPNLDSAFYYFQHADQIDAGNSDRNTWLSGQLRAIGLLEKAELMLKKILLSDPANIGAMGSLGDCQLFLGDVKNAEINFKKILETDDGHVVANYRLGFISFFYKNDMEEAKKIYEKISKIDPNCLEAKTLMSWFLAKDGKKREALKLDRNLGTYSILNMKKEAIQKLDSMTKREFYIFPGPFSYQRIKNEKFLDFIRNEPEFQTILLREKKGYEERLAKVGHMFE